MSRYAALPATAALALPITLGAWSVQAADIIQTAQQDGRFDGFLYLLEVAGMVEMLQSEGPFTVFAPIDDAFLQLPPGPLDWLLADENREPLKVAVQSHIVADAAIRAGDLLGRAVEVPTLGGGTLAIDGTTAVILLVPVEVTIVKVQWQAVVEETSTATPSSAIEVEVEALEDPILAKRPLVGVATVVEPDIQADNGVIHGIDLVLLPPEVLRSF